MKTTILFFLLILGLNSCGQGFFWSHSSGRGATVTTSSITNIAETSATGGGNITNAGLLYNGSAASISARGVCWSTTTNPTISDSKTTDGSGTGSFTSSITGVTAGTPYYVRAYATNEITTAYGDNVTFTPQGLATVTTAEATDILSTSVTGGGNVTNDGGGTVSVRGVCYSYSTNPTIANFTKTMGSGTGVFSATITNQISGDYKYYAKAYATNGAGTSYGNEITFTTPCNAPPQINGIGPKNKPWASGTAIIEITYFYSESATEVGVCYNTTGSPTTADAKVTATKPVYPNSSYTVTITGLTPGGTYYFRGYGINPCGTGYYNTTGWMDAAGQ